jgi:hypothetical protein
MTAILPSRTLETPGTSWMEDWKHSRVSPDAVGNRKPLEKWRLLGCGAMWVYYKLKFQRNVLPPSSGYEFMNRDLGFCLSKSWKPLTSSLKKCLYLLRGLPLGASAARLLCATVSAHCEQFFKRQPHPADCRLTFPQPIPPLFPSHKVIISAFSASKLQSVC